MTDRCEICGDEVDDFGCLGELRGRHVAVEMALLRARAEAAEQKLTSLRAWLWKQHARGILSTSDVEDAEAILRDKPDGPRT